MSLENVPRIDYIARPTEHSFLPYQGIDREEARSLAKDFAKQQDEIYALARSSRGEGVVTWSSDGKWLYAHASDFEIVAREDNKFNLNFSKDNFANQIAKGLGVESSYYLGTENGGAQYFFDANGNFGKTSYLDYFESDCIEAYHESIGRSYFYRREQMQASDFQFVADALTSLKNGMSLQVTTES